MGGHDAAANADYGRGDDPAPWGPRFLVQLGNALATLYFKDLPRYGTDIETLYMRGIQVYPEDKEMWNNLGYLYTQRNQWPQAAKAYQSALQIDPNFDLARRNLAVVLQKMGNSNGVSKR